MAFIDDSADELSLDWRGDSIYCEAYHQPHDVYYEGSEDEEYDTPEARQAAYEAAGQRYLEGQVPFLLTAQLRGPFSSASGWKNPWQSKPRPTRLSRGEVSRDGVQSLNGFKPRVQPKPDPPKEASKCHLPSPESLKKVDTLDEHRFLEDDEFAEVQRWRASVQPEHHSPNDFWTSATQENQSAKKRRARASDWLKVSNKRRRTHAQYSPVETPTHRKGRSRRSRRPRQAQVSFRSAPERSFTAMSRTDDQRPKHPDTQGDAMDTGDELVDSPTQSFYSVPDLAISTPKRISPRREIWRLREGREVDSEDELSQEQIAAVNSLSSPMSLKRTKQARREYKASPQPQNGRCALGPISSNARSLRPPQTLGKAEHSQSQDEDDTVQTAPGVVEEEHVQRNFDTSQETVDEASQDEQETCTPEPTPEGDIIHQDDESDRSNTDQLSDLARSQAPLEEEEPELSNLLLQDVGGEGETSAPSPPSSELSSCPSLSDEDMQHLYDFEEEASSRPSQADEAESLCNDNGDTRSQKAEEMQRPDSDTNTTSYDEPILESIEVIEIEGRSISETSLIDIESPYKKTSKVGCVMELSVDAGQDGECSSEEKHKSLSASAEQISTDEVVEACIECASSLSPVTRPVDMDDDLISTSSLSEAPDSPIRPPWDTSEAERPATPETNERQSNSFLASLIRRLVPVSPWAKPSRQVEARGQPSRGESVVDGAKDACKEMGAAPEAEVASQDTVTSFGVEGANYALVLDDQPICTSLPEPITVTSDSTSPLADTACEASVCATEADESLDQNVASDSQETPWLRSLAAQAMLLAPSPKRTNGQILTSEPTNGTLEPVSSRLQAPLSMNADIPVRATMATEGSDKTTGPKPATRPSTPEPQFTVKTFASFMSPSPSHARQRHFTTFHSGRRRPGAGKGMPRSALRRSFGNLKCTKRVTWAPSLACFEPAKPAQDVTKGECATQTGARSMSPPPITPVADLPTSEDDKFREHFTAVARRTNVLKRRLQPSGSQRHRQSSATSADSCTEADAATSPNTAAVVETEEHAPKAHREQDVEDCPEVSDAADIAESEEPVDIVEDLFRDMDSILDTWNVDEELDLVKL